MKKTIALLALIAATCSPVLAGPLKNNVVPTESKIVVHIDMEAFRASKLAELSKTIEDQAENSSASMEQFKKITDKLGFDPSDELASITMYSVSTEVNKDGGVIIAESANPVMDEAKIVELIKSEAKDADFESTKTGDITIYTVGKGEEKGKLSFIDNKTIVLSNTDEQLLSAIKTFSNKTGNFKSMTKAPAGSFISVQATGLDSADAAANANPQDPTAAMSQGLKSVTCFVGENQGNAFINLKMATISPDTATQYNQMVQAMLPIITMQASEQAPEMANILQKVKFSAVGSNFSISLTHPAKDLIAAVKKGIADTKANAQQGLGAPVAPAAPAIQ